MVNGKKQPKVGDIVHVLWGLDNPIAARVLEVWGDAGMHVRVQLMIGDDDDPVIVLLSTSSLVDAA